jgi:hypothetical protein
LSTAVDGAFLGTDPQLGRHSLRGRNADPGARLAVIARGEHRLLLAPTGSGKTLAAFLWGIERISRLAAEAPAR